MDQSQTTLFNPSKLERHYDLDARQATGLQTWILANEEEAKEYHDPQLAEVASKALGFPVGQQNISSARKKFGIKKNFRSAPTEGVKTKTERLEKKLDVLTASVEDLNRKMSLLCVRMNVDCEKKSNGNGS